MLLILVVERSFRGRKPDSFLNNDEVVRNGNVTRVDNQRADSVKSRCMRPVSRRNQNSRSPVRDPGNGSESPREKLAEKAVGKSSRSPSPSGESERGVASQSVMPLLGSTVPHCLRLPLPRYRRRRRSISRSPDGHHRHFRDRSRSQSLRHRRPSGSPRKRQPISQDPKSRLAHKDLPSERSS